jgi:hypothetical protein
MSSSHNKEHPSTYFVQDRSNKEEVQRLQLQDHLLTTAMGGVLPEYQQPHRAICPCAGRPCATASGPVSRHGCPAHARIPGRLLRPRQPALWL